MKPISKKIIGDIAKPGQQLRFTALFSGKLIPENAYATKMVSPNTFILVSESDNTLTQRCKLVNGTPISSGQCQLLVTPFGGTPESCSKIMSHLVETFSDHIFKYNIAIPASAIGEATVRTA